MTKIFISYASPDHSAVVELRDWLIQNGFDQVFYDQDPQQGIQAGEHWQEKLLDACRHCEAVIFLISDAWLNSNWCVAEYLFTRNFGKRCLPVLIEKVERARIPDFLTAEHQVVDFATDPLAYDKLKRGLEQAGVAADSFALPEGRRPYPGLEALHEDDAAIFFGRDAQILEAMDELRRMATTGEKRIFVILGASGTGKSSLLRAGLIPRLRRNQDTFLPFPVIRPDRAILTGRFGLWASIENMVTDTQSSPYIPINFPRNRAAIAQEIESNKISLSDCIEVCCSAMTDYRAGNIYPTAVLSIDQGEELFNDVGKKESRLFFELIGQALQQNNRFLVIIAMRSDAYSKLQVIESLPSHLHALFNLAPMHPAGFKEVIERPGQLCGIKIEPALTDALLSEARGADALPLLAYTLERLHREYGADGELRLDEFNALGGMTGMITTAVEDALRDPPRPLPEDSKVLYKLLRRALIPHLVAADESGVFVRRIAQKQEIPEAALPLINLLIERRLLIERSETHSEHNNTVIEIAHEALLRSWPLLVKWLEEERDFLIWRAAITNATAAWQRNERGLLTEKELVIASEWLATRSDDIPTAESEYIKNSADAEAAKQTKEKQRRRLIVFSSLAASAILLVMFVTALWQWREAETASVIAQKQANLARAREMAIRADNIFDNATGRVSQAAYLATASLKLHPTLEAQQVLNKIMHMTPRKSRKIEAFSNLAFSPRGDIALNWSMSFGREPAFGEIYYLEPESFDAKYTYRFDGYVTPDISPGGELMAIGGFARKLQLIELKTGKVKYEQPYKHFISARFDGEGKRLFVVRGDGVLEIRQAPDWRIIQEYHFEPLSNTMNPTQRLTHSVSTDGKTQMIATWQEAYLLSEGSSKLKVIDTQERAWKSVLSPDGQRAATVQWGMPVILWDSTSGKQIKQLLDGGQHSAAAFSAAGDYFASATEQGDIFIWKATTGERWAEFVLDKKVNDLVFSENGRFLAAVENGNLYIWDIYEKKRRFHVRHDNKIRSFIFANNDQHLIIGDDAGLLTVYDLNKGKVERRKSAPGAITDIKINSATGSLAIAVTRSSDPYAWADMRATNFHSGELLWEKENNGQFSAIVFSPDGGSFATSEVGKNVKIWDAATGKLKKKTEVSAYRDGLTFSADGNQLLVQESGITLIDVASGKKLATMGEPGGIDNAVYHTGSDALLTFGADLTLRSWNIESGQLDWQRDLSLKNKPDHFSGDGKRYIEKGADQWRVIHAESGDTIFELPPMRGRGELSEDGRYLVRTSFFMGASSRETIPYADIEIWDVETRNQVFSKRYEGRPTINFRFLSRNRIQIFSSKAEIFDIESKKILWEIENLFEFFGNSSMVDVQFKSKLRNQFDPLLLTRKGFTEFRDQQTGKVLGQFDRAVWGVTLPDRPSLMVVVDQTDFTRQGHTVALINWQSSKEIWRTEVLRDSKADISELHFTTNHEHLLLHVGGDLNDDRRLIILDLENGNSVGQLQTDSDWIKVWSMTNPDLIMAQDFSKTVRIWQLSSKAETNRFSHTHTADGFVSARNENRIATYSGGSIRVWDIGELEQILHRQTLGSVSGIAIRPDGRQIAYLTHLEQRSKSEIGFHTLVFWNLDNDSIETIPVDSNSGNLHYDPTGKQLVIRAGKNTLRVLDTDSFKLLLQVDARAATSIKASFSLDGKYLHVDEFNLGGFSGYRLWDVQTKKEIARLDGRELRELPGTSDVTVHNRDEGWRIWDLESGDLRKIADVESAWRMVSLTNGSTLAWLNPREEWFQMINTETGHTTVLEPVQQDEEIKAFGLSSQGDFVVFAQRKLKPYRPGTISLRNLSTEQELALASPDAVVTDIRFVNNDQSVILLGTPGGEAAYGGGTSLFLWHWQKEEIATLSENQPISAMAVSPKGNIFATGEGKLERQNQGRPKQTGILQLRVWDTVSGKELHQLPFDEQIYDIAFSADGKLIAVYAIGQIRVFNVSDLSLVKQFAITHSCNCGKVHFGKDNRVIVTGTKTVQVWDPDTDRIAEIKLNRELARGIVSKNGTALAVNDDNMLRIWDLNEGVELLRQPFERQNEFAFTNDNRLYAHNSTLGLVEIPWRAKDLINESCQRFSNFEQEINEKEFVEESLTHLCVSPENHH